MRVKKRSLGIFVLVCFTVYLVMCLWAYTTVENRLASLQLVQHNTHNAQAWGFGFFRERCQSRHVAKHGHSVKQGKIGGKTEVELFNPGEHTCSVEDAARKHRVDIQMEKEWDAIQTGYPQYVYTVSGWMQVIEIQSYTVKGTDRPLQVIIVPHSHQDPGWLSTFESYYSSYTQQTLSTAVGKLMEHPHWKFMWAEVSFLARWWKDAGATEKEYFKTLVKSGQIEIVTGGWVVSDEASVHYQAMLDQLIEGHQWLQQVLGTVPQSAWSIDQFGYSPTMPYMMKRSGLKNVVIQRVNYAVKRHLASSKDLEFYWRQAWDAQGSTDILCHMMPFLSYNIPSSCGPDPFICCKFDFSRKKCTWGQSKVPIVKISDENIASLSWQLWEQFQKKAQIYRSNVLLVPHGDDFRYSGGDEWDDQLGNLEKLMTYMNQSKDMHVVVKFGTVSDYFKALEKDKQYISNDFPSFSGDFFPYNDRDDQFWTGYFTSRPLFKHIARILQSRLRLAEIVYSLSLVRALRSNSYLFSLLKTKYEHLVSGRQALALFEHHDAITGTSRRAVVENYASIIHSALKDINALLATLITSLIVTPASSFSEDSLMVLTEESSLADAPPRNIRINLQFKTVLVLTNSLTVHRNDVVSVIVSNPNVEVVESDSGKTVLYQVNPVYSRKHDWETGQYEILFEVNIAPLSLKTYHLVPITKQPWYVLSKVLMVNKVVTDLSNLFNISTAEPDRTEIAISNQYLLASFSTCTGLLHHIQRKVDESSFNVKIKFVTYGTGSWKNPYRDKSGAYVFLPDGPAKDTSLMYPSVFVVSGPVSSSVYTKLQGVVQKVTLHNIAGPLGSALIVNNDVNIGTGGDSWNNKELVMRLETDVNNHDNTFCVDLNGFQMHRKKTRSKLPIQGNFHPLTTATFLEDDSRPFRLTLLTSEAHGMASLNVGWLEVVLDRRLMQDDWRGLSEGVTDNRPTPSQFMIVLERMQSPTANTKSAACFLSSMSTQLSQYLNNPILSLVAPTTSVNRFLPHRLLLTSPLPCALNLLNLRSFQPNNIMSATALLIVHHAGLDCRFPELSLVKELCKTMSKLNLNMFTDVRVSAAVEMNLSGVQKKRTASLNEEIVPPMEIQTYKVTLR
ncbi:alpha-mannosidase 2-like [Gigantopelta aegis]|uniref:alpha-mannosidase 2-like n=1 Tax=Gigantopelta aegis TaxID=1735272 RepID=UPI001B8880A9|nr:alpha-mannosidase 2-like [Gigantopelta aegis]